MRMKNIQLILILFFIILLIFVGFNDSISPTHVLSDEETKTASMLQSLETQDITQINKEIAAARKKIQYDNLSKKEMIRIRFQSAVLVGDSIAEGMLDYRVVDARNVYCKRGLRIDNCIEYLDQALKCNPDVIFLQFGINDLEYCKSNAKRFINYYQKQIDYIQKKAPKTKIFVNALLPIKQAAIDEIPAYQYVDKYNQALIEMCNELDCGFIDNEKLLKEIKNPYEQDGVHPRAKYYPLWAENMLMEAGL